MANARIVVDFDLCEANRVCERVAPEFFRVDDNDMLEVLQTEIPDALRAKAEKAVRVCPRTAISIEV